jgi:hypothetical protein
MSRLTIYSRQQDLPGPFDNLKVSDRPVPTSRNTAISNIEYATSKLDKAFTKAAGGSRKRKRSRSYECADNDSEVADVSLKAQGTKTAAKLKIKQPALRFESLRIPDMAFPKSAYRGHDSTLPVSSEWDVLQDYLVGCA